MNGSDGKVRQRRKTRQGGSARNVPYLEVPAIQTQSADHDSVATALSVGVGAVIVDAPIEWAGAGERWCMKEVKYRASRIVQVR